jgi:sodium transport system ATP-binding protein
MITVKNLAKSYGKVDAVTDVNFSAEDGQITTLLGVNGSGKTTTLRAIAGLINPDRGEALIDGFNVAADPIGAREKLGFVPDEFGLYTRLTAREHMFYFGRFHGLKGVALEEAAEKTIQLLHMEKIADRRTEGFSLGERAKVSLARAMIHSPQNIILDEPTRGLDVLSIRLLRGILNELKQDQKTILFSSHVMAEVEVLSDKVVLITQGRVVAEGRPEALVKKAGTKTLEDAFVKLTALTEDAA